MKKIRKRWALAGLAKTVRAHTKSEARSIFKRILGLKGRLPAGTVVTSVAV
jgi:hypothetical protein